MSDIVFFRETSTNECRITHMEGGFKVYISSFGGFQGGDATIKTKTPKQAYNVAMFAAKITGDPELYFALQDKRAEILEMKG